MNVLGLIALAIVFLGLIAVLICQARTEYTFVQSVLYVLCCMLTKVLWRAKVVNKIPVPPGQGALIAANHRSSIDPFFVQISSRRVVHWLVAHEFFELRFIGYFLRQTGAIPTTRAGTDTKATREAIRFAQHGELVGVLPEGKINQTDDTFMLPVRAGAAMIAIRAGVPIVPCYIDGAPFRKTFWSPFLRRAKVRIEYGRPIPVPENVAEESRREVAEQMILEVVAELAHLANRPDFKPTLR
jgi:1-acyl-sn-glycerol-3-phosphate acyltransferase